MKIGIPKGLGTYEYPILYTKFFELLGIEVVLSEDTNHEIIDKGIELSIDENCLASKIFMGHVANLAKRDNLDYIFIPRLCTFSNQDTVCVKFYALYDICKNVFKDSKFLTINIDYQKGENELKAFVKLGRKLGINYSKIVAAYLKARNMQRVYDNKKLRLQNESLKKGNINILLVAHSYIAYDKYMGHNVSKYLVDNNINVVYANINSSSNSDNYTNISSNIYWKSSKNLLNGIIEYKERVDGIIYLSAFPCGIDCLVNELSLRKIADIPSINIIIDEQDGTAGLYTRLESFIDILEQNKENKKVVNI